VGIEEVVWAAFESYRFVSDWCSVSQPTPEILDEVRASTNN